MPNPVPQSPATPAADPHSSRLEATLARRRALGRRFLGLAGACALVLVTGAIVTGALSVTGTGTCEGDGEEELCVRRTWWPLTIQQRAEQWTVGGVPDGPRVEWHRNGQVWFTGTYDAGVRDGLWQEFWDSGALRFSGTYVDGQLEGPEAWYFADGTVEWTVRRHAGKRVGEERWYWPGGVLRRVGAYVDGEKHGPFVTTDERGQPMARVVYDHGVHATP